MAIEPLLIELKRIGAQAKTLRDAAETKGLLVELMQLRGRLEAERDEHGREIETVQRSVAAMNAYRRQK